jgi:nicotinamidase-related amidase
MPGRIASPFRRSEPPPIPRLEGGRVALLVVDMQYFDAHAEWGEGATARNLGVLDAFDEYFTHLAEAIPRIQSLLAVCRAKGIEVIHIRVAELTNDSHDVGLKQVVRGLAVPKNSKEAQLLEDVQAIDDEIIVSKSSSGAFATTNLDRILRNMGIDTLLFAGTSTAGCVESTASDAVDLGYTVIVASDACACSTRRSHAQALERMAAASIFTATTEEIRSRLADVLPVDRSARSGVATAERHLPTSVLPGPAPENPYSLIFGPAVRLLLDPAHTAVVIVDPHRFACDPACGLGMVVQDGAAGAGYYDRVRKALPNIARLLDAGRKSSLAIAFVRTAGESLDGRDLSPHVRALGAIPVTGGAEAEILPDLAVMPGELVLNKPGSGVCTGTGLDERLRHMGVRTVVLAGVSYDGGLERSVRGLTDRGYGVVLVPDACATFNEQLQRSLWTMETGITNVLATSDVITALRGAQGAGVGGPAAAR